jgi:hypothetical protein
MVKLHTQFDFKTHTFQQFWQAVYKKVYVISQQLSRVQTQTVP